MKPLVSFLRHNWLIVALFVAFAVLSLSDVLFQHLGTLVYLPVLSLGAIATALLIRHIANHQTSGNDVIDGTYVANWSQLTPQTRTILTVAQLLVYFVGVCLIAAALIK